MLRDQRAKSASLAASTSGFGDVLEVDAQQLLLRRPMTRSLTVVASRASRCTLRFDAGSAKQSLDAVPGFVVAEDRQQRRAHADAPRRCARRWPRRPRRSSRRCTRTTGTGASGEMRSTSPNQYGPASTSPTTSTRRADRSSRLGVMGSGSNAARNYRSGTGTPGRPPRANVAVARWAARSCSGRCGAGRRDAPVDVVETDDVVLADVVAALHLDQRQSTRPGFSRRCLAPTGT